MKDQPKVIKVYKEGGVTVTRYAPEEDWPTLRKEFYTCYCGESRGGSALLTQYEETGSDATGKHIQSGEGEAGRCTLAKELGGTFTNDPYYKIKGNR